MIKKEKPKQRTKVGCHVSIAGGVENSPGNAKELGAECFQIFSRSPRGGNRKKIEKEQAEKFLSECKKNGFDPKDVIIHSPYFINFASKNNRIYYGSISAIREELETASLLKVPFVVTHMGSAKDFENNDKKSVQKEINEKVLKALREIYKDYAGSAILLLEIAAGSGNIIGDSLDEIAFFIEEMEKEKTEIGFCFDTCHAFAAGVDLRTKKDVEAAFKEMDEKIGLEKLKTIHLNDSMTDFDSKVDRHGHLGKGKIGEKGIFEVVKKANELGINLIVETKHDAVVEDMGMVNKLLKK